MWLLFNCRRVYVVRLGRQQAASCNSVDSFSTTKTFVGPKNVIVIQEFQRKLPFNSISKLHHIEVSMLEDDIQASPRVLGLGIGLFILVLVWSLTVLGILLCSRLSTAAVSGLVAMASLLTIVLGWFIFCRKYNAFNFHHRFELVKESLKNKRS